MFPNVWARPRSSIQVGCPSRLPPGASQVSKGRSGDTTQYLDAQCGDRACSLPSSKKHSHGPDCSEHGPTAAWDPWRIPSDGCHPTSHSPRRIITPLLPAGALCWQPRVAVTVSMGARVQRPRHTAVWVPWNFSGFSALPAAKLRTQSRGRS